MPNMPADMRGTREFDVRGTRAFLPRTRCSPFWLAEKPNWPTGRALRQCFARFAGLGRQTRSDDRVVGH